MKTKLVFILFFVFICGLFVEVFNPVLALDSVGDSWLVRAPMNQARVGLGAVEVDGNIYAIGGCTTRDDDYGFIGYVGTNERYDPMTDTWTILEPMPTPRYNFAIVAYQDKIYCIGGTSREKAQPQRVRFCVNEVYDIASNTWSTKANMPFDGSAMGQVINGKFFIMISGKTELYMYDPIADVWTNKTSMTWGYRRGYGNTLTVVDNKLLVSFDYAPSGFTDSFLHKVVMIYDPETDVWSKKTESEPFLGFVYEIAGATSGRYASQKVYLIGWSKTTVYDPKGDIWSTVKAMPTEREVFAVVVLDDTLYVIGGGQNRAENAYKYETTAVTEQYIPLNYSGTVYATPEPTKLSDSFINTITIVVIVLTASVVVIGLFLYLRKKSKKHPSSLKHVQISRAYNFYMLQFRYIAVQFFINYL